MRFQAITAQRFFRPALGAGLTMLCGLGLWMVQPASWVHASYDHLFRFSARGVTNQVVLVLMDNLAYDTPELQQTRGRPWSRSLHAKLLQRLADDACALVVLDIHFEKPGDDPALDHALAEAMRRQRQIVLMADQQILDYETVEGARPLLPAEPFLGAARTNWGLGKVEVDTNDLTRLVRQHWRYPSLRLHPSLPWAAAQLAGADLREATGERWLRYYGTDERIDAAWTRLSYGHAFSQSNHFFRDKTVFIGSDEPEDEFHIPLTPRPVSGVKILATEFLNLVNGDWLRRFPRWIEAGLMMITGLMLGGGLPLCGRWVACGLAAGAFLAVMLGAACLSYFSDHWFPWLFIAGGQIPCALAWAFASAPARRAPVEATKTVVIPPYPDATDYELFGPSFGRGAYGEVWVVRNSIGQWQALKVVNRKNFDQPGPYEREWRGITNYKPISDRHPGLLRVDFVSRQKPEGYFYYVMELGDAEAPGWENARGTYRPRNLHSVCEQAPGHRLDPRVCAEIGLALAEALEFLHGLDLTHRDIKPSNVIFVNGRPKLADVGLVTEVQPGQEVTWVGTTGYMPPMPEPPGTKQADIFALGMVLYVISTGGDTKQFPELPTALVHGTTTTEYMRLNPIILKASDPDHTRRYATVTELREDLEKMVASLK